MQVVLVDKNHSLVIGTANQFTLAGRSRPEQVRAAGARVTESFVAVRASCCCVHVSFCRRVRGCLRCSVPHAVRAVSLQVTSAYADLNLKHVFFVQVREAPRCTKSTG